MISRKLYQWVITLMTSVDTLSLSFGSIISFLSTTIREGREYIFFKSKLQYLLQQIRIISILVGRVFNGLSKNFFHWTVQFLTNKLDGGNRLPYFLRKMKLYSTTSWQILIRLNLIDINYNGYMVDFSGREPLIQ